jgi:hypothetical protein
MGAGFEPVQVRPLEDHSEEETMSVDMYSGPSWTPLTQEQKVMIAEALGRLGPERVEAGTRAFEPDAPDPHTWGGCFLARCYGEPGAMNRAAMDRAREFKFMPPPKLLDFSGKSLDFSGLLGVPSIYLETLVAVWDSRPVEFVALVEEWLERNRVANVPRETLDKAGVGSE